MWNKLKEWPLSVKLSALVVGLFVLLSTAIVPLFVLCVAIACIIIASFIRLVVYFTEGR